MKGCLGLYVRIVQLVCSFSAIVRILRFSISSLLLSAVGPDDWTGFPVKDNHYLFSFLLLLV